MVSAWPSRVFADSTEVYMSHHANDRQKTQIAALDARREAKRTRTKVVTRRTPTRRRQVVYDDFGKPLRVVWVEE